MTCSLASFHASDLGTFAAGGTEVSTLPQTNLLKRTVFDRWRTLAATGNSALVYGSALSVSQVVLLYTNATPACTVRVRAGTNPATVTASPSFDSGAIDHQPGSRDWTTWTRTHFLLDLSAAHSALCWRIDVNQVSGASYYEAARVGFLDPLRPTRGIDWGDRIVPIDGSRRRRSRNGTAHPVPGGIYREADLSLASQSEAEMLATFGDLQRRVVGRIPFLYCKRPRAVTIGASAVGGLTMYRNDNLMDELIYGYLRELYAPDNSQRQVFRLRLALEEAAHP